MALNKVMLIGNVGKDPEVRYLETPEHPKVAQFTLATSERYKAKDGSLQEQTEWHNIVAWRGACGHRGEVHQERLVPLRRRKAQDALLGGQRAEGLQDGNPCGQDSDAGRTLRSLRAAAGNGTARNAGADRTRLDL